jgi:hypothetical protein
MHTQFGDESSWGMDTLQTGPAQLFDLFWPDRAKECLESIWFWRRANLGGVTLIFSFNVFLNNATNAFIAWFKSGFVNNIFEKIIWWIFATWWFIHLFILQKNGRGLKRENFVVLKDFSPFFENNK